AGGGQDAGSDAGAAPLGEGCTATSAISAQRSCGRVRSSDTDLPGPDLPGPDLPGPDLPAPAQDGIATDGAHHDGHRKEAPAGPSATGSQRALVRIRFGDAATGPALRRIAIT